MAQTCRTMNKYKILFIYTDWAASEARKKANGYGGVSYYRIMKPARELQKLGFDVTIVGKDLTERFGQTPEQIWPTVFSEFDAVIVKQMDNPQAASPLFYFAERYGKPVIIDLDDNYFAVKPDQPAWEQYHPGSQKRAILAATLSLAAGIFVSTDPLKEAYKSFLKDVYNLDTPIFVLPNCNDVQDWKMQKKEPKERITIGYAGSITHSADLKMVLPALLNVMRKDPRVHFEILGAVYQKDLDKMLEGLPGKLTCRFHAKSGTHSWAGYPELLCSQNWDLAICPLVDDEFTRGKSHIKWMEYTMAGFPVVASPTYPYIEPIQGVFPIEDGKTGLFAHGVDEWEMVLSRLIADSDARTTLAGAAYEAVKNNWQYADHAHKWAAAIHEVICNFQTRQTKTA